MPEKEATVSIESNSEKLEKVLLDNKLHQEIKFVKGKTSPQYKVFFVDLQKDISHISQKLIETYGQCRENDTKLAVVILHGDEIDIEKNHYFQKMLDDLGKEKPLHRLVFTKDIYQHYSPDPATSLDQFLYRAITKRKISISQKGENLLFPLSLEDFTQGLIRILFLSNTSGKTFWLLGDSLTDLETSYLLKQATSTKGQDELEINATEKNNPETGTLSSVGNKTRAEINWQPENEIMDNLKQIVATYKDNPVSDETSYSKINYLHQFINWLYRPRPETNPHLPTLKKIGKKLLFVGLSLIIILSGITVLAITTSLQQINKSLELALAGDIKHSVKALDRAVWSKEIGESIFLPIGPVTSLIFPQETEKFFNLFSFINYTSSSLGNLHQTYIMAENLLLSLNDPETKTDYEALSLALRSNLSQVYENLNQTSSLISINKLPLFLDKKIKANSQYQRLKILEEQIAQYIKVTDLIPRFFSKDGVKTILVLLQNSQALRPSGGKTDYYLLLTLDQGKLISKVYYTEEELNKLYSAALTPAKKINRFTAAPAPKLQDLLQEPDFSKSAGNVALYLEKATRTKPDFIIAINDSLIRDLLLEEKSQEADLFMKNYMDSSGSAVIKDQTDQYLTRLFDHQLPLPILGRGIAKTLETNQILLWSADTNTERLIVLQPYSGVIALHPCSAGLSSTEKCLAQTSYLSESTFQNSRQYPWSKRLISHSINITSPQIKHEYQIDYKVKDPAPPETSISVIYHLYLPSPSTLDRVLVNNLPSSTKNAKRLTEGSFDHYEIPMSLYPDQDTSVIIQTTTPISDATVPLSYSITEYRQPGTNDPGISLKISHSENLRPAIVTSPFEAQPSEMRVSLPPHTSSYGFTLVQSQL